MKAIRLTPEAYEAHQKRVRPMTTTDQMAMQGLSTAGKRLAGITATTLRLPWPPTVNHYYWHAGVSFVIKPAGKTFRKAAWAEFLSCGAAKLTGRIAVEIQAFPPDRRKRDLDNLLKPLLDALQHAGCFDNDGQVDRLLIERGAPAKGGYAVVRLFTISGA